MIVACSQWRRVLTTSAGKDPSVSGRHLLKLASLRQRTSVFSENFAQWQTLSAEEQGAGRTCETPWHCLIRGSVFFSAAMVRFYMLWMGTLLHFCHAAIYTNDWAIRIRADRESVDRIAEKYGFTNMGQVGVIQHTEYKKPPKRTYCRLMVSPFSKLPDCHICSVI